MKLSLTLGLALALAAPMALRADDGAAAKPAAEAKADDAGATAAAKAEATPVAKNDAPGSITPGNELIDAGKYAEAVTYFDGIGEQVASNGHKKREPWRLVGLATAQIGVGKFDDAAANAQKALDIDGNNSVAWNDLGSALAQGGKRKDAVAAYTKGIEALKVAKMDSSKLENNMAPIKASLDDEQAKADKKAGIVHTDASAMSGTAKAADAAADTTAAAASK